ncbi:MAG: ammonia-forming cytochrome c nitrite reductase [Bacteroidota bacterium]
MKPLSEQIKEKRWKGWALFIITLVVVFFLGLLASSIIERRTEAQFAYVPQIDYPDWEPRNELWGKNFPREWESYLKTSDTTFRSLYNGSASIDFLERDPKMVILWAGYAFSKDYYQARGHLYAIRDIRATLRTGAPNDSVPGPQPNTCWTCKSPDVPRVMAQTGVAGFYKGQWETLGHEIVNPIGCADCHDAQTMDLHITRPALIEAFKRQGKDITQASHQEMRSLVCAQCHVEYYFNKKVQEGVGYLTFPWDNGFSVDSIEKYYDNIAFTDWEHKISRTPMLKAQHPDYELFSMGVHSDRGLACADCHMPYRSEGGVKFTDHHIQSPLNNVANSCQVCHREETARLISNVYERQNKIFEIRDELETQLVHAHYEAGEAWERGASPEQMKPILTLIRHAQWRWDFAAAGHGSSFHAPLETSRIIATGLQRVAEARRLLTRLLASQGMTDEVKIPDISTKEKAQKAIGLDLDKLQAEKSLFLKRTVPEWDREAQERESAYKK